MESSENSNGSDESVQEMDAETKAILETGLKSWSASSAEDLIAAETEREYKFSTPPDWKCIRCKTSLYTDPYGNSSNRFYTVYQCQTGHLACYSCSQSGEHCCACSKAISRIRNLAVEDIMESLVVTCKFANLGCKVLTRYGQLDHEKNCSFAPMVCLMPGCSQAGVKNLLAQHLLSKHKISFIVDVQNQGYRSYEFPYSGMSGKFELDSSTTSVLVRHVDSKEVHLLCQESTTSADKFQIIPLEKSCKRKYELEVTINEQHTYCLKSVSTWNMQQGGQLVICKHPGDGTLKKCCKIYM